jgi:hypothetical protein
VSEHVVTSPAEAMTASPPCHTTDSRWWRPGTASSKMVGGPSPAICTWCGA